LHRYFAEIQYNGTNFHGWQRQPNAISIQQVIEENLYKLFQQNISIVGCGRTDTGVHASQYYFHFDCANEIDAAKIRFKLNCMVGNPIYIKQIFEVEENAHARFSAKKRSYYYHISLHKNPFLIHKSWFYPFHKLNINLMQKAASDLLKYNDFPMFCKAGSDVNNYICKLFESKLVYTEEKEIIEYHISANRFLRNMIRRIMGTLIEIGIERLSLEEFNRVLKEKENFKHIFLAPADGLFLSKIEYPFINNKLLLCRKCICNFIGFHKTNSALFGATYYR